MTENTSNTSDDASSTPVPNVGSAAVSGIDREKLQPRERSTLAGSYREEDDQQPAGSAEDALTGMESTQGGNGGEAGTSNGSDGADGGDGELLRGEALEDALEERGLPKTGSADEKRRRVAEYDARED